MLNFLDGAKLLATIRKDKYGTKGVAKIILVNGDYSTKTVTGSGFDKVNAAIADLIAKVINKQELDKDVLEELTMIDSVSIGSDGDLLIDGASGRSCWVDVLDYFGFTLEDLQSNNKQSYYIERN